MLITPLSDGEGQATVRWRGGGASYSSGHSLPSPTGRGEPPSGGEGEGLLLIIKQMLLLLRRQAVIARPSDLVQNTVGLLLVLLLAGVIIPVGVAGA